MTASALDITRGGVRKPLAIDLYCGLGGWTDGLLAEGFDVIGFDIEQHVYGEHRYPAQLVIQDVLTLRGSQFRDASLIVASPPCQFFSYCAMPWSRAKALAGKVRADPALLEKELALFRACFRVQREACAAAGRHIPMVVENVRGAIPWVGRSRWNFGSYHLWGDVPALMPATFRASKMPGHSMSRGAPIWGPHTQLAHKVPGFRFDGSGRSFQSASVAETGVKAPGMNWSDQTKRGQNFTRIAGQYAMKAEGRKGAGAGAGAEWFDQNLCQLPSASPRRKAASAMIAKITEPLSRWIARCFLPRAEEAA